MNFVDQATVTVRAGKGGNGSVSFRHERFAPRGGPDGGDGGDGGDIVFVASNSQSSLAVFRYTKHLQADSGGDGGHKRQHGKNGHDLIVAIPVGTEVKDEYGTVLADLVDNGQKAVVAIGGYGGFGNAHFVSSRRQAPNFAEKGEPGEAKTLTLELKMLADVGLVGLPNAGKSTLLGAISHARPKVADYPFTTLGPSVGVVDVDKQSSLLFADIPGLIAGAAAGRGLGHDFLRHVERTAVIVHLIDAYNEDIVEAYLTIRRELAAYNATLAKRPEIIAINKTEGLDEEITNDLIDRLRPVVKPKSVPILIISAKSRLGLRELITTAQSAVNRERIVQAEKARVIPQIFEYKLEDDKRSWRITPQGEGVFLVEGEQLQRFALRTDFNNDQAIARLRDILRKRGVLHALIRAGIKPGNIIDIAGQGKLTY